MSIASEISRLQGAKANLKTAIEGKGVTVPSATKIDGYASLVSSIPSGGGSTLITKSISANGTYNASSDSADGYSQVTVSVPASAVDTGTKQITSNGNGQDVVGYAAVDVAVPNSYSAGDEGKVVSNGALVAQTAHADVIPTTSDQTIDTTLNNSLKVKGDANLVAGNIKKDVTIFGTTGTYEGGGGGSSDFVEYLQNELTTYSSDDVTTLKTRAFNYMNNLTYVSLPNLTSFPAGNDRQFESCLGLVTLNVPKVTVVPANFCLNCTALTSVTYGAVTSIGSDSFRNTRVPIFVFPSYSGAVAAGAFQQNPSLTAVDLASPTAINGTNAFYSCSSLTMLVIRRTGAIATLNSPNSFNSTPFASSGTGGTLYVPNDLISSYQSASNWSTILGYASNQIKSIESTHTDPNAPIDLTLYYADGTPIAE